jgi:hypothetical protein
VQLFFSVSQLSLRLAELDLQCRDFVPELKSKGIGFVQTKLGRFELVLNTLEIAHRNRGSDFGFVQA